MTDNERAWKRAWKQAKTDTRLFKLGRKHKRLGKVPQRTEQAYLDGYNYVYQGGIH